jgi:hypothetical protein
VAGVPFLILRTCSVTVAKSICSHLKSTSSAARSPCLKASNTMRPSRWPCLFELALCRVASTNVAGMLFDPSQNSQPDDGCSNSKAVGKMGNPTALPSSPIRAVFLDSIRLGCRRTCRSPSSHPSAQRRTPQSDQGSIALARLRSSSDLKTRWISCRDLAVCPLISNAQRVAC